MASARAKNEVIWTRTAEGDLIDIVVSISGQNPKMAASILESLIKKAEDLTRFSSRGRIVPELAAFGVRIYREVIKSPWRIIYRIEGKKTFIMAVIDSRRNVEDLLLRRFWRD